MYANNVEIEKVLKAATPGPWEADESDDGHEIRMGEAITNPGCYSSHLVIEYNHGVYPDDGDGKQFEEAEANANLIANAPKWLKQLLKENGRLIDEAVKYRQEATNEREQSESIVAEREELNKEIERQEMRYQTFASEAVSNIKIRDNTIARQNAKIQALESKLTRLMNGTNGYA